MTQSTFVPYVTVILLIMIQGSKHQIIMLKIRSFEVESENTNLNSVFSFLGEWAVWTASFPFFMPIKVTKYADKICMGQRLSQLF